jgi:hypothetical protein
MNIINDFEIRNIKYYNGNKNFVVEFLCQNSAKTIYLRSDEKVKDFLSKLENISTKNHERIDITLITNSFYENSLNLLKILKEYPKLFTNTTHINVAITSFLIMGWSGLTEIPYDVKEAFKNFYSEANKIGFELQNYRGETKLVLDKKVHLFSDFL